MIKTKSGGKFVKINRQWIVGEGTIKDTPLNLVDFLNPRYKT
ncbi:MAG: hypothetical protein ACT6FE_00075 [Methanosarcinaceae archaeon]